MPQDFSVSQCVLPGLLAVLSQRLCCYEVTDSVIGVLTNGDGFLASLLWLEGEGARPSSGLVWVASLPGTGAGVHQAVPTPLTLLGYMCGSNEARALRCAGSSGWMGQALLGTSSCLLQGTGMFLCVEMALLWFPSPPLPPVEMAASSSRLRCSEEPAGGGSLGSLAPRQWG